jgi:hypothetical protein
MRRLMAFGAAAVVGAVLFMGAPAYAATGYPPPTTTPGGAPTTLAATCPVGSTCTISFAGFAPGTPFQIFVNGQLAASGTVGPTGTITVTLTITDPHISVNGGPLIAVPFGTSTITAVGTGLSGGALTVASTVNITPAAGTSTGVAGTTSTGGSSSSSGGSLAFTGAQIGMMVGGGLLLLVAGTGLVLVTRQRRSRTI